ncbi:MAG: hypothetical protein ACR2QM_01305 [Longimicrobiales bacterium]
MNVSLEHITDLYNEYKGVPVLSLILPLGNGGTLERTSWRLRAEALVAEVREALDNDDKELAEAIDLAWERIADEWAERSEVPPPGTWVAFATAEKVCFSHIFTEPLPALARFGPGPRIAPLTGLAELKQRGVVALVDSGRARLFNVVGIELEEVVALIADRQIADLSDVGMAKRAGTTSGVRGQSGKDRAERALSAELHRFARYVKDEVARLDGTEGFLILGGALRMAKALLAEVSSDITVAEVAGLTVEMSQSELAQAIRQPLADIHEGGGEQILNRIEGSIGAQGRGCLGWNDTSRALMDAAVQTLVLSRQLVEEYPDRAEETVRAGIDQGGSVEVLTGEPGRALFEANEGVGALLRFVVPAVAESVAS